MLMKSKVQNSVFIFGTISLLFLSSLSFGQDSKNKIFSFDANTIGNLKTAIKSENPGLRKSGIYLAGKYSVTEVSETLLEQLKCEHEPELKILLIRVLYIIDDQNFMNDILSIAANDTDLKVRRMATAVYSAMKINSSDNFVKLSK